MKLDFSAKRVFWILMSINLGLILLHLILHGIEFSGSVSESFLEAVRLFSLDQEANVPTWFAQTLLLTVATLFGLIGCQIKKTKKSNRWPWFFLSIVFVYLSIDEGSQIHELTIEPFQNLFGIDSGLLFFAWIIPVGTVMIISAALLFRFFKNLDKTLRAQLFFAATIFIFGAIGMEMISGSYWESVDFVYDMRYRVYNAIEEGLENAGSITAIYALYVYFKRGERKDC